MKKKIKNQSVAEIVWNIRAKRENCIDSRSHHFDREGEEGLVLVDCGGHEHLACANAREIYTQWTIWGSWLIPETIAREDPQQTPDGSWSEWTPESQRSCS